MKLFLILILLFPMYAYGESNLKNELDKTISTIIELIEKRDDKTLLNTYAYTPDGKDKTKNVSWKKMDAIKVALGRTKDITPTFTENDTIATYESDRFPSPLRLKKVDGIWKMMEN